MITPSYGFGNQREIWASEESLRAATMMAYSPFAGLPSARKVFADYMNEFVLGGSPKQPLIADNLVRDVFFRSIEPPIVCNTAARILKPSQHSDSLCRRYCCSGSRHHAAVRKRRQCPCPDSLLQWVSDGHFSPLRRSHRSCRSE